jgi:hypothetical protein
LNGVRLATRRPLLVKLGNSPPERPQSGLDRADVVVEHLTEGAITRFSAIFYCSDAVSIGPIRSARLIDLELVPMFNAIFAHVGGSEPVRQLIAASPIAEADFDDYGRSPIFREVGERKRPFNRYTSTAELYELAVDEGMVSGDPVPGWVFDRTAPAGGRPATHLSIPYRRNLSDAVFDFDTQSGVYQRSTGTTPHIDAVSSKTLTAANVLVLFAPHETTDIIEDSLGSRSIRIDLHGEGDATLLRDGQVYTMRWARTAPNAPLRFTDVAGKPVAFKPGNVWIEVVPTDMQIVVE